MPTCLIDRNRRPMCATTRWHTISTPRLSTVTCRRCLAGIGYGGWGGEYWGPTRSETTNPKAETNAR